MSAAAVAFNGEVPAHYDRGLGASVFAPYAAVLAQRTADGLKAMVHHPGPVLETACGTGRVTEALRQALPADRAVLATDLSADMLGYARTRLDGLAHVRFEVADMLTLPATDASAPAVVCQFGLMFVPDKAGAVAEARRVLASGGFFHLAVWDSLAMNPFGQIADRVLSAMLPPGTGSFFSVPFGFHDEHVLRALLAGAGFEDVRCERLRLPLHSPDAGMLAHAQVHGSPVASTLAEHGVDPAAAVAALTDALTRHGGARPFESRLQALILRARAPG